MPASAKPATAIGYLTVRRVDPLGWIGGYLILNTSGRPLEFHCTAPIKPTRTQEILYGAHLLNYLYVDVIGPALLERNKAKPLFIGTDLLELLPLRPRTVPLVYLPPPSSADDQRSQPHFPAVVISFPFQHAAAAVHRQFPADAQAVVQHCHDEAPDLDVWEPLQRLHEAIEEAQRTVPRAA